MTSSAKRRQFEYFTALHKSFMTTLKDDDGGDDDDDDDNNNNNNNNGYYSKHITRKFKTS